MMMQGFEVCTADGSNACKVLYIVNLYVDDGYHLSAHTHPHARVRVRAPTHTHTQMHKRTHTFTQLHTHSHALRSTRVGTLPLRLGRTQPAPPADDYDAGL
jgi:hypothetical protein